MPEYKHEAHCQFEGLGPCLPCRSESPRTCTVASLFTEVHQQNRAPHAVYMTFSFTSSCLESFLSLTRIGQAQADMLGSMSPLSSSFRSSLSTSSLYA